MLRLLACAVAVAGCNCQPPVIPLDGGAVPDASTESDAGRDAGPDTDIDGGALECAAALTRGESGTVCTFSRWYWCHAADFACGAYAACGADGGLQVSTSCRDAGTVPCFPFATGTTVTGTTPLGAVDFRASWGSPAWAFEHDLILQLSNTPTAELGPAGSLGIFTGIDPSGDGGYRNIARLVLDGGVIFTPVSVRIDGVDAGRSHGFITIDAPGWSVSGPFDAPMCPQLDRSGP